MIAARTQVSFDAIQKQIPALWGKPRIASILLSWTDEIQELEDAIFALIDARLLDNATGVWLAFLGKIVGQPNLGFDDVSYRAAIRARVRANRSSGRAIDLFTVANLLTPGATVRDGIAPLNVAVEWGAPIAVIDAVIAELMPITRSAGTSLSVVRPYSTTPFTYRGIADSDVAAVGYASTLTSQGGRYSEGQIL